MSANTILLLCAQAVLAQIAFSYCVSPGGTNLQACPAPYGGGAPCGALGANSLAYGLAPVNYAPALNAANIQVAPTSGGALPVTSSSSLTPTSLSITSENVFEGALQVIGELPFLSVAALEGMVPSAGAGLVNHSYGNGVTAITSVNNAGGVGTAGVGAGLAGINAAGYCGSDIIAAAPVAPIGLVGSRGCGCGGYY